MHADRTELNDLAGRYPDRVQGLSRQYDEWAARCQVLPWDEVKRMYSQR